MKILVPVDGSPYGDAAVAFVAERPPTEVGRPPIDLLNVQLPVPPRAGRAVDVEFENALHEAESAKVLKPAVAALKQAGLEPAWFHRVGQPGAEIAQWADEHGADLIVMGSHGRTALKNLLFGSVTQTVLASTAVPVLVLRTPRVPWAASLRVGIALDGSTYGLVAARYVLAHRALFGRRPVFTLLHVVEPAEIEPHVRRGRPPKAAAETPGAAACERVLAPAVGLFSSAGAEIRQQCIVGRPGQEIARFASSAPLDILVIGSHGHGALTSALLGSVAWRVAAGCDTPLLLVRMAR